jgi:lambda family portal protein
MFTLADKLPQGEVHFGYNATEDKGRRQAPREKVKPEDFVLTPKKRKKVQATNIDQQRNTTLLAWMVRRHLDYVSRFDLHIRTGIPEIDKRVQTLFKHAARKENFDIAGRHDRNASMRLFESVKTLKGDCGFMKIVSGHLQAVESDRVQKPKSKPEGMTADEFAALTDHGLLLSTQFPGRVERYAVVNRDKKGNDGEFAGFVDAENMIFDGYYTQFDQTRGISPLVTAVNMAQDLSETFEWFALKQKVHALFGVAFERASATGMSYDKEGQESNTNDTGDTDLYSVKPNPDGILNMDMRPGDKVSTIESKTPSADALGFTTEEIRIICLALDIPFTAYNSMKSSFSARIADRIEYEVSAAVKREKNQNVLYAYSDWKLNGWAQEKDALGDLLNQHQLTVFDIQAALEWIAAGTPWLDKSKELDGDMKACALSVDSIPRAARRRGGDAFRNVDENADLLDYAKSKGVPVYFGTPGQATATEEEPDDTADDTPEAETKPPENNNKEDKENE